MRIAPTELKGKLGPRRRGFLTSPGDVTSAAGGLIESFGWPGDAIRDLGDILAARATEGYLLLLLC